jgi:Lipase (class 3)
MGPTWLLWIGNRLLALTLLLSCVALPVVVVGAYDLVLSEKIMQLTLDCALLSSNIVFKNNVKSGNGSFPFSADDGWKLLANYTEGSYQATVAKKSGYCFAAFRGKPLTWKDWMNFKKSVANGSQEVCVDLHSDGTDIECCNTSRAFSDAYTDVFKAEMEAAIRDCAEDCTDKDDCVVLTGHSFGGAVGMYASLLGRCVNKKNRIQYSSSLLCLIDL